MSLKDTQTNIYNFLKQFAQPYIEFTQPSQDEEPTKIQYPYLTFSSNIENWDIDGLIQIRLWDKTTDTLGLFTIADNINSMVKEGYIYKNLVFHKGTPFVQVMPQDDRNIKCLYINLQINYL